MSLHIEISIIKITLFPHTPLMMRVEGFGPEYESVYVRVPTLKRPDSPGPTLETLGTGLWSNKQSSGQLFEGVSDLRNLTFSRRRHGPASDGV